MVPGGLLMSAVVASVGADGVSDSGSEVVWVGVGSGVGGSAVARTVVSLSPVLRVVRDGDAADGVGGATGASVGTSTVGGAMTGGAVGTSGVTTPAESLCPVVTTSSGEGAEDGVDDGGAWVTMESDVGGGCVGLAARTAPERKKMYHGFHKNIKQHKFSTWIITRNVSWAAN